MKRVISIAVTWFACGAAPVMAADIPVKARPVVPVVIAYNWSGCYIGGYVGGATTARNWSSTDIGSVGQGGTFPVYNGVGTNPWDYGKTSSFIGGGTAGCNYHAAGSPFVVGLEGEVGYLRLQSGALQPNSQDVNGVGRIGDWYGVIALRGGWAIDRVLFYLKGGVAFYESRATVFDFGNNIPGFTDTVTANGGKSQVTWALGGGIEYAISDSWSIKGEYLYLGRGDSYNACGVDANVAQNFCWRQDPSGIHTAKFGLNYRFGGAPLIARY